MADVYAGALRGAEGFERRVAIKYVREPFAEDAEFVAMFRNEARICSLMQHENIVRVLDFDRDPSGRLFLVMELVRGVDLTQLTRREALPVDIAMLLAGQLLRGLAYAHELTESGQPLGLIHRDITPHNVLVSEAGVAKIADFGIAKVGLATQATRPGTMKGKLGYMSPEQVRGEPVDPRSDLFSLGVLLYECVVGERLFRATTEAEVLARTLYQPIVPAQQRVALPDPMVRLLNGLLSRVPGQRPPSARHALDLVAGALPAENVARQALGRLVAKEMPPLPEIPKEGPMVYAETALSQPPTGPRSRRWWGLPLLATAAAVLWFMRPLDERPMERDQPDHPAPAVKAAAPNVVATPALSFGPAAPPPSARREKPKRRRAARRRPAPTEDTDIEVPLGRRSPDEVPLGGS